VNYYKRHIGDYAAKAGHLTPLEHGVYTLILDAYYNREEAPTKQDAVRWARARTRDEVAAVDVVLTEFFEEVGGRFIQKRVEEELEAFRSRRETNRKLGAKGGKAKGKANGKRIATESLSDQEANDKPSHKPLAISQEASIEASTESTAVDSSPEPAEPDSDDGMPRCPVKRIVALYHEVLPELPPVQEFPEASVKMLRQRWRSDPERQSLDWWRGFFSYVRGCPFLMGEKTDFTADLLWLVRPTNFAKVLNGNYQERAA